MKVDITICREGVNPPAYQTDGAVGFDIAAAQTATIEPRGIALIPTGLIINVPDGYMLMLTSRSSNALKKGIMLANGVGTIDQDYCGPTDEIHVLVYNFTDHPITIEAGARIANGIFIPIKKIDWRIKETATARSRGGFGSTGN